ncbi:tetratricopeptide repeat protein [Nostoc sp. ChiVER01]|uniref:tetratricopeptide repeat protein n=1 Tax=Nostoc sp. ChiVER01 TaxID=3075382 RepID=UPI002AD34E86|nr:tetratricopeptide repeat protein [Nostoc sp. ChiVER01]MDZ8227672.1 tetratricopeptide repeat protein [Nostoc sp. ChiVER01]
MFNLLQPIVEFYNNNKDFINNLLSGAFPAIVGVFWWLIWQYRQRRIPEKTFAFEVIKPKSQDLMQRILGGNDDDPLADRNIVYQQRVPNRHIRNELKRQLEEHRWILILGRTGLGKTREAAELAKYLNQEGWTVLYLKLGEWLDIPAAMPKEIGTNRKLLFFFDDLNQKMYASRHEISPEAERSLAERFQVPLQERLLQALNKYEELCEPTEIRVIATARNERYSEDIGKPSPWEKLQWDKYPKLWNRFKTYELPQPEDDAIIAMLAKTVPETNIKAETEQYPELARRNDSTFRNVVENLHRLQNESLALTVQNYRDTLKDTWKNRYNKAVEKYSVSRYIYDAVDLLQQFDLPLYRFTVEATARMLAARNFWQQLWYYWQIRRATNYLISAERILEPRDGQIEAKPKQVEAGEYTLRFTRLILQLAEKHQEIPAFLLSFSWNLINLKRYQDALRCLNKALTFTPDSPSIWFAKGNVLVNLRRSEEAIASYDQAIKFKSDGHEAWYNRGIALVNLERLEEAIASYDKALKIKPNDHETWYNRGIALVNLRRLEEAIASYDKALKIKPDYHQAWYNRGIALKNLERLKEAIISYDKALKIKPDYHEAWNNRGNALFNLRRLEEAIASYDKALKIKPDYHDAWYNRGIVLFNLRRLEKAIASYDKALEIKPDYHDACYNKAYCYSLLGNIDLAIDNLQQAINLNPEYRETAKTDLNFGNIREDQRFQDLISH